MAAGWTFTQKRLYYNLCNTHASLPPDDARNVHIDDAEHPPRGVNWSKRLADTIALADQPLHILFSGLPGSGKSTELKRLVQLLERSDYTHLLPVYIDAGRVLDLSCEVDVSDILLNIVHETELAVLEVEGATSPAQGYLERIRSWLGQTQVDLTEVRARVGVPGVGDVSLVARMRDEPNFRQQIQVLINARLTRFLQDACDELEGLEARAQACGYEGLVVIFDSLEKLQGTSSTWQEVLTSAERLFHNGAPHLRLPVHALYTIPPALIFRANLEVEFMPMIKLRHRSGEPCESGMRAARELIRRRIPDEALGQLLGEHMESQLEGIIYNTGGYPREMVRFLRRLCRDAEPGQPATQSMINRIQEETREEYRRTIPEDAWPWLAQVAHSHESNFTEAQREVVDRMFTNNAVLFYRNSESWYDLHPAVSDIPGVQEALRRLESGP